MTFEAQWPAFRQQAGRYESFYMRAASPDDGNGVWIRYTVQKAADRPPKASVWFTMFDHARGRPVARKSTFDETGLACPAGGWISIGESSLTPHGIEGSAGDARWSLSFTDAEPALHHLSKDWIYRARLPKTKPESPVPFARFSGEVECDGRTYVLDGWPGMVGHNWGAEHAWTWIWLSGAGFAEDPSAWIDLALGRVKIAGRLTPWVANGAVSLGGRRHRLGGLLRRGVKVEAAPGRAKMRLPGSEGCSVEVTVEAPRESTVAWNYGSPGGHVHDVLNCSIAKLEATVSVMGEADSLLSTAHGGTYELGLPEPQSWVKPEPMPDEW